MAQDFIEALKAGRLGEGSKARWARLQAEKLQLEAASMETLEYRRAS